MLEPFTDAPKDRGLFVNTPENLYRWVSGADKAGLHVIVHAIGDRAIRTQLDIFERVAKENGPRDRRFRIEHAQHIAPRRHPAVRAARRDREHAAVPRDRRRTLGGQGHRPRAREGHVRVPVAARRRRDAGVRQRLVRRAADAARGHLRRGRRAARSTTATRAAGFRSRRSPSRRRCARTRAAARSRRSRTRSAACLPRGALADFAIDRPRPDARSRVEQIRDARIVLTAVGGRVVYERKAPE